MTSPTGPRALCSPAPPKLHANRELTTNARIVEALKEINQQEETDEFFDDDQRNAAGRGGDQVAAEGATEELDYLIGVAKDFAWTGTGSRG